MFSPITKEEQIEKGTIFRYIGPDNDSIETNELCIYEKEMTRSGESGLYLYRRKNDYSYSFFVNYNDFKANYRRESGNAIDQEISSLLTQGFAVKSEIENLNSRVEGYSEVTKGGSLPNVTENETKLLVENTEAHNSTESDSEIDEIENIPISAESSALVQTYNDPITLARTLGKEVANFRNLLDDKKEAITKIKKRVEQLQELKKHQIELLLKFQDLGKKIEKVLTTIKLYLGTGEEIVQIGHGAWAHPDTKLAIRQLVLHMDEESLILAESGGMDFKNIQQFDEWLLSDPKHLKQIIPEEKGIVCLKPRRKRKDYGNKESFIEDILNARNVQTYILIRHGENLFRVTPDWGVGSKLFPSRREFEQFFCGRRYNYSTNRYESYVITPDSREFDEAVGKMDSTNFHYRNTLVMIQGIIDRTGIFADLQERGVNLLDMRQNSEEILYVNDGDENYLLHTGKETFDEYQKRLNLQLNVGNRIILGRYTGGSAREDDRIYPKTASYPETEEIYTLEASKNADFVIRYERDETIWVPSRGGGYDNKAPEKRASMRLYRKDKFIIAYDLVAADEMDYFINDRLSRSEYMFMIPLLKTLRNMKRTEELEEEPFLLMLVGELLKINPQADTGELNREARKLINWWKFKNRYHRSVKDDYSKALRMVLKEYALKQENQLPEGEKAFDAWRELITPETLFIGQQNRQFIRYEKVDNYGAYLTQTNFNFEKSGWKQVRRKEKFILRKDLINVNELYADEEWKSWLFGFDVKGDFVCEADAKSFLSMIDDESSPVRKELELNVNKRIRNNSMAIDGEKRNFSAILPMAMYITGSRIKVIYYTNYYLSDDASRRQRPQIYSFSFEIGGYPKFILADWNYTSFDQDALNNILGISIRDKWFPKKDKKHYLKLYQESFPAISEDYSKYEAREKRIDQIRQMTRQSLSLLREKVNSNLEEKAKQKYLESFGDERNWDYYKRNANIEFVKFEETKTLEATLDDFLTADDDGETSVRGKTLAELKQIIPNIRIDSWRTKEIVFPERLTVLGYDDYVLFPLIEEEITEENA